MKNVLNIRIPSFVGILLLLLGVGVTSYLVDQGIILEGRAAPEEEPTNIAITNISPTSFTVMYTTDAKIPGTISYGTDTENTSVAYDDRDKQNARGESYTIHHITVTGLKPDTTYYFSILSGNTLYQNDGEPYEVTTAPEIDDEAPETPPITGRIAFPESSSPDDLLLLVTSDETQNLSTIITSDGSYSIPTTGIRNKDLTDYVSIDDTTLFDLTVLSHQEKSDVTVLAKNINPVPIVMFGQSYDFTISTQPLSNETTTASESAETYPEVETETGEITISIISPEDRETFEDDQPLFSGKGVPGEEVTILIDDTPIGTTVSVDSDGDWAYRPDNPLTPGNHKLTIQTKDLGGTTQTLSATFTVFAEGSQFTEPSVSPTRTPTPTLSISTPTVEAATPTPTVEPTAMPTVVLPELSPTEIASASPEPTRDPMEPSGPMETAFMVLIGTAALIGGAILFFLAKGSTL